MTKPKKTNPKPSVEAPQIVDKTAPKQPSKASQVQQALKNENGASVAELIALTGWQTHTVRGYLSTLRKKLKTSNTGDELMTFTRPKPNAESSAKAGETAYKIEGQEQEQPTKSD